MRTEELLDVVCVIAVARDKWSLCYKCRSWNNAYAIDRNNSFPVVAII